MGIQVVEAAPLAAVVEERRAEPKHEAEAKVVQVEVPSKAQQAEIEKLRLRCKEQQEEISRLLLMIEEMRHRMEQLQKLLAEKGGYVADELEKALEKVGLKEVAEAKPANLRNVYERLYQDAIERMRRCAITLEQKVEASKQYFAQLAVAKKVKGPAAHAAPPNLERLTEAAALAIHGMWYHYDILFRRVCQRSTEEAVKQSAIDNYKLALSEIFEYDETGSLSLSAFQSIEDDNQPNRIAPVPFSEKRRICYSAGAVSPGGGIGFASQQQRPRSSCSMYGQRVEPESFKSFVCKVQQAEATPKTGSRATSAASARSDSLGALTRAGKRPMASNRSLPVLPKGLGSLKPAGPEMSAPNSATSRSTSCRGSCRGQTTAESSVVLQDSWMAAC